MANKKSYMDRETKALLKEIDNCLDKCSKKQLEMYEKEFDALENPTKKYLKKVLRRVKMSVRSNKRNIKLKIPGRKNGK